MKRAFVLLAFVACVMSPIAKADTVIDFEAKFVEKRGEPGPTIEHHTYSLGETQGRVEQGDEAYVVDTEKGSLYYLDLDDRHVQRYPSPLHNEDTFPPQIRAEARRQLAEQTPKHIEVTELEGTEEMGGFTVRHVVLEAGGPGEPMTAHIDLWVSSKLWEKLEQTAYWDLERDRLATSPFTAWIAEPLRKLRAFPVRTEMVIEVGEGRLRSEYVKTLVSWKDDVEVPESAYRVPEGFTSFPLPRPDGAMARRAIERPRQREPSQSSAGRVAR